MAAMRQAAPEVPDQDSYSCVDSSDYQAPALGSDAELEAPFAPSAKRRSGLPHVPRRAWRLAAGALLCGAVVATSVCVRLGARRQPLQQTHGEADIEAAEQPVQAFEGKCSVLEKDMQYEITQGGEALDHIPDPSMCCAMCQGIPDCVSWVWKNENLQGSPYRCHILKVAPRSKAPAEGVFSGMPPVRPSLGPAVPPAGVAAGQPSSQATGASGASGGSKMAGGVPAPVPSPIVTTPEPVDPRASCAAYGENCFLKSKCCQKSTMRCYMKTPQWAGCLETCEQGIHKDDPVEAQTEWACVDVDEGAPVVAAAATGQAEAHYGGAPVPGAGGVLHIEDKPVIMPNAPAYADRPPVQAGVPGLTLYCFALAQPQGYEPKLLADQYSLGTSIFACEEFAIFSSMAFEVVPGIMTETVNSDLKCEFHEIAWNTNIFIAVWQRVINDGSYRSQDWTVKVDPDATFLAPRLRAVLEDHRGAGYIGNCKFGLHGPIEVFSRAAVDALAADYAASVDGSRPEKCVQAMPQAISGRAQWGEDMFMDKCLSMVLGIQASRDDRVMCEAHCECSDYYFCANGTARVSYHPFKRVDMYRQCLANMESGVSAA